MVLKTVILSLVFVFANPFTALQAADVGVSTDDRTQVELRVRAYLDALVAQDIQTAYQMQSGARDKTLTASTFQQHMSSATSVLVDYEIQDVTVESDKATVEINASYRYPQLYEPLNMPRREAWIRIEGEWYRQPMELKDSSPLSR